MKLISSIFPEKIEFNEKKCRTKRINDVLRYILHIEKELGENKKRQISKNMSLSRATVRNSSGDLIVNTNVYFKFNVI